MLISKKSKIQKVREVIKALGYVYFDLNSSYLSSGDKKMLDKLISILNQNSKVNLKDTSYTNLGKVAKYNQWLFERRLKQIVKYLISKSVSLERLKPRASGEEQHTNISVKMLLAAVRKGIGRIECVSL